MHEYKAIKINLINLSFKERKQRKKMRMNQAFSQEAKNCRTALFQRIVSTLTVTTSEKVLERE